MTRIWMVSLVVLGACGGTKSDGPASAGSSVATAPGSGNGSATAGSGSAAAPPPAKAFCVAQDHDSNLSVFVADDKSATFCLAREAGDDAKAPPPRCATVDFASGTYRAAAAAPVAPAAPAPAFTVAQDAKRVEVCNGASCKKLDVPKPQLVDGELVKHQIAVSADGKRAVVSGRAVAGLVFLDATTGKKLKSVKLGDDSTCLEETFFVGDSVYVGTSNCAGPGGGALLYSSAGKRIAELATEESINLYGAVPVHVGGDHWAAVQSGGGSVLVFDAKTGKQVSLISVPEPEPCDGCGGVLGTPAMWKAQPLIKLPSGKLATIQGVGVSILDGATGKVDKTYRMPICPDAP